ncbi:MAG: DedA family protein [Mesorhizobium sp.]|nr:DedA family protein [Mesorhizobium sp.]
MIDTLHMLIERYGLVVVFLGCLAEGESAAILGGVFAHQHVFLPWQAFAVAFVGAFLGDTAFFLAGRRYAGHRYVLKLREKPGFSHAYALVQRHPDIYVLANRFIYGVRLIGGVAAGLSDIAVPRFLLLNALSAAVWAALFVSVGFFFGLGAERLLGDALMKHERLLAGIALAVVVGGAGLLVARYLNNRNRNG